jgi:hypothetical protein
MHGAQRNLARVIGAFNDTKPQNRHSLVIPAKAGIQRHQLYKNLKSVGPCLRRDDAAPSVATALTLVSLPGTVRANARARDDYMVMMPRRMAIATAWVRSRASSLAMMLFM